MHPRQLHVGAPCTSYARLKTGATYIFQLLVLHNGAVRDLCGLWVHVRAARSPKKAYNILPAAQCPPRRPFIAWLSVNTISWLWWRSERVRSARRVSGGTHGVYDGDCENAPEESIDKAHECPEAKNVWERKGVLHLPPRVWGKRSEVPKRPWPNHITVFFLGAAHFKCYLERQISFIIPVFLSQHPWLQHEPKFSFDSMWLSLTLLN